MHPRHALGSRFPVYIAVLEIIFCLISFYRMFFGFLFLNLCIAVIFSILYGPMALSNEACAVEGTIRQVNPCFLSIPNHDHDVGVVVFASRIGILFCI